jgi:glycosidase
LNPTLINDQPKYSYHGYALTDHYLTDPRFGTNNDYKKLGAELKKRNMKLVMDLVPNHIGDRHWMFLNMPEKNLVNQWPEFTRTNYRAPVHYDPYASKAEKKLMTDGWFDNQMPDVNETNPRIATYLMQSYLWWINFAGIDGFRIDTYSYNDLDFMTIETEGNILLFFTKKDNIFLIKARRFFKYFFLLKLIFKLFYFLDFKKQIKLL